jgi:hypothetical protein
MPSKKKARPRSSASRANEKAIVFAMTYIASPSADGKSDLPAQRELMLADLHLALARAKLEVQFFESLIINIRQKAISCAGAREKLRNEGLLNRLGGAR